MDSVIEARRAKFEAWVINFHRGSSLDGEIHSDERYPSLNGQWIYDDWDIHSAWAAYNAALDSLVIELPKSCAYESLDSSMVFVQLTYELGSKTKDPVDLVRLPDVRQAIEKAGVKVR